MQESNLSNLSVFEVKNLLTSLDSPDIYKLDYKEIEVMLVKESIASVYADVIMKPGYIFRGRPERILETDWNKSSVSYRPDSAKIDKFGRVNNLNQSIFYASENPQTAINEIYKHDQSLSKQIITMSRWRIKQNLEIMAILGKDQVQNNQRLRNTYETIMNSFDHKCKVQMELILNFFSNEFAKSVEDHNQYKITCAYFNIMLENSARDFNGVMYPSVKSFLGKMNLALTPECVDKNLELDSVYEIELFKDDIINGTHGKIIRRAENLNNSDWFKLN